jgi:hypothetical protein
LTGVRFDRHVSWSQGQEMEGGCAGGSAFVSTKASAGEHSFFEVPLRGFKK